MTCQPNSRDSSTDSRKSFKVFMPQDSRRRAGITTFLNCQKSKATRFFGKTGTDAPWVFSGGRRPELLRRTGLALGRVLQMATPWLAHARRNPSYSLRLLFCRSRFV